MISDTITLPPTAPSRSDPTNFRSRADLFFDWLSGTFPNEMNSIITDFNATVENLFVATSTSSVAIGTGSKSFTVAEENLALGVGSELRIAETADPATNYMDGIITAYTKATKSLTVAVSAVAGSGTISAWTLTLKPRDFSSRVQAWSGMSGAVAVPMITSNNGDYWAVNTLIDDVTASEPTLANNEYHRIRVLKPGDIVLANIFDTTYANADEFIEADGTIYEAGAYPALDATGVFTQLYPTALDSDAPGNNTSGTSVSSDGIYIAAAMSAGNYFCWFKNIAGTYTKQSDPATLPTGYAYRCAWSPDDTYVAVVHQVSPYVTIYKRSGDTLTKLSDPATPPAGISYACCWSSDSVYLAVAHATNPYITIYKRSGDTFTKLTNPALLPASIGYGVAFSPDDNYLAVAFTAAPYLYTYSRSGDTFTKLADPDTAPGSPTMDCLTWSPCGDYVAIGYGSMIRVYAHSSGVLSLFCTLTCAGGVVYSLRFVPDVFRGRYLLVGHADSPYMSGYRYDTGIFEPIDIFSVEAGYYGLSVSSDGLNMATTRNGNAIYARSLEERVWTPTLTDPDDFTRYYIYAGEAV